MFIRSEQERNLMKLLMFFQKQTWEHLKPILRLEKLWRYEKSIMSTIIGLGKAGCNIAKEMSIYPQYKVFCIDSENMIITNLSLLKAKKL
jgi:hypothetical protein